MKEKWITTRSNGYFRFTNCGVVFDRDVSQSWIFSQHRAGIFKLSRSCLYVWKVYGGKKGLAPTLGRAKKSVASALKLMGDCQ